MSTLVWDQTGERKFETGVSKGVLFHISMAGLYDKGYAWNGLTGFTESPSGAEPNKQYADNMVYLNLVSAEEFAGTLEAFTYPDEFGVNNGEASPVKGVAVGQQPRKAFGLSYRTEVGNDVDANAGYKIHLVWGCLAAPSEKSYATVNDTPEAMTFSWEISTTPLEIGTVNGVEYKPTATITLDSTELPASVMTAVQELIYGTAGTDPRLPSPREIIELVQASGALIEVTATEPAYNATTKVVTIPSVTGVTYRIDGKPVSGNRTLTEDTVVTATANGGYKFPAVSDDDWLFEV